MISDFFFLAVTAAAAIAGYMFHIPKAIGALICLLILSAVILASNSREGVVVYLMLISFNAPMVLGSAALGLVAGSSVKGKNYLPVILIFSIVFFYFCKAAIQNERNKDRTGEVHSYVVHHPQIKALSVDSEKVSLSSRAGVKDNSDERYEFNLHVSPPLFAIVRAHRNFFGTADFQLECVTPLPSEMRETSKGPCEEKPVVPGLVGRA